MSKLTPAHMRALGGLLASESPDNVMKICRRVTREDHDLPKNKLNELNDMFAEAFPGQPIPGQQSGGANISKHIALGLLIATMVYHIIKRYFRAAGTAEEDDEAETAEDDETTREDDKAEKAEEADTGADEGAYRLFSDESDDDEPAKEPMIDNQPVSFWVRLYIELTLYLMLTPRPDYDADHTRIRNSHRDLCALTAMSRINRTDIGDLLNQGTLNYTVAEILCSYPLPDFDYQVYEKNGDAALEKIKSLLNQNESWNLSVLVKSNLEHIESTDAANNAKISTAVENYHKFRDKRFPMKYGYSDTQLPLHILKYITHIRANWPRDSDTNSLKKLRPDIWATYKSDITRLVCDGKLQIHRKISAGFR